MTVVVFGHEVWTMPGDGHLYPYDRTCDLNVNFELLVTIGRTDWVDPYRWRDDLNDRLRSEGYVGRCTVVTVLQ